MFVGARLAVGYEDALGECFSVQYVAYFKIGFFLDGVLRKCLPPWFASELT